MEQNRPSVKWFIETQSHWFIQNGIPEWFHGVITRKEAENLLQDKTPGCFLIRVSESRIGYSLSYRILDRYRHFMIDILKDQQCIIAGDTRIHLTLDDLVKFHKQFPLHSYNEILTLPCGQKSDASKDYEELFEDRKTFATPLPMPSKASVGALAASGATLQPACPPIPRRRCQTPKPSSETLSTPCILPPNQPVNRLYPTLPTQLPMSNNSHFVLSNTHPAMTKSNSLDSPFPPEALDTNSQIKQEEMQGHTSAKPLKAYRNAVTKSVSLMTEGKIAQDFKKMETAMATHLRSVKENFERFGQTGQRDGSPKLKVKHTTIPEEYKAPPPFAPGFP
ncbi:PREDICTED: hematopoietic SH2 domain-containing protein [Nanorana parkeri]|uniref:hematopoietic SH2 domain-containing protein n=1 Tax=Nanorana parkeri TaxID=125878 RepID=UPI00085443C1|nr:PREDICTED: hematopoietic SH2 domain-containing protein [Nanorana parkeri]